MLDDPPDLAMDTPARGLPIGNLRGVSDRALHSTSEALRRVEGSERAQILSEPVWFGSGIGHRHQRGPEVGGDMAVDDEPQVVAPNEMCDKPVIMGDDGRANRRGLHEDAGHSEVRWIGQHRHTRLA